MKGAIPDISRYISVVVGIITIVVVVVVVGGGGGGVLFNFINHKAICKSFSNWRPLVLAVLKNTSK